MSLCLEEKFPNELELFRDLKLKFFSEGFNRFKSHFPDEFKIGKEKEKKVSTTSKNPYHLLQFVDNE